MVRLVLFPVIFIYSVGEERLSAAHYLNCPSIQAKSMVGLASF